ncbi:MAG TPA: aspartate-alanine antiporter [Terriglobales bacterium]|jgi:putative transport protein|nr:aspartate-alanine antiporter [Terriglobales bacterium]
MGWLANVFTKYPEMAVYLAIGIGYLIGRVKFRGVGLGVVTGSLLGGILIGNFFHVPVSDQAKAMLFLLFLFGIGYSVGPSFFSNLKGEGWRWAVLGVFVPVIGLITAYGVAHSLKLDPGYSAGMLSGSLTESPAIGTASEAIRALSIPDDQKQQWIGHVAVADAICYIFGTLGVILVCASFGPKLLRIDLRAESKKVEEKLGIRHAKLGVSSAWQSISYRAYTIRQNAQVVGKTIAEAERSVPSARLFVERIRRSGQIFSPLPTTVLEAGDTVAVLGRTEALVNLLSSSSIEASDPELLEIPVASYGLYVSSKTIAGKTLSELSNGIDETRGVLLRGITRGGQSIPIGESTIVERGDTLQVTGSEAAVERLAPLVGKVINPTEDSDFVVLGLAVFLGVLTGAILTIPVGSLRIALGTSVGTLLAGVLVGWIRSVKPWFGRMPDAAISFMKAIGLAAFVAMVGLKAGPIFVQAVKEYGYILFLGGIVVTLTPLVAGLFFGRYILKLNPVLLLGGLAGAQTMIAGVAAVQEKSDSPVATLGYSYTVAFGHILLTTWGTIIVALMS